MNLNDIDIVIPWVDGSDPKWNAEKNKYEVNKLDDARNLRYRDMENIQYIFRGIEKFAPWVNKIYFVTWGHIPDFLNLNHPKLEIVNHKDFIPEEYLPVFSSHPIELNFHRIPGLSEQFIYFNDDMFLIRPVQKSEFFIDGLPRDEAQFDYISSDKGTIFPHILLNNLDVLNQNYNKKQVVKSNKSKWFSKKYSLKTNLRNLYFYPLGNFTGMKWHHQPSNFLKSTLDKSWEKYYDVLDQTCQNKFRSALDVNQYLFLNEQIMAGKFHPKNMSEFGKFYNVPEMMNEMISDYKKYNYKTICINDASSDQDFDKTKDKVIEFLNEILPDKSEFER